MENMGETKWGVFGKMQMGVGSTFLKKIGIGVGCQVAHPPKIDSVKNFTVI